MHDKAYIPLPRRRDAARRGFTLVEMLLVVTIVGLLVSVVLPSLGRARQIARRVTCRSNLHGVAPAFRMYLNESNDVMPVAAAMPSLGLTDEPRIADVLARYLDDPRALRCPGDNLRRFYQSEGSSYQYNTMLGGRKVTETFLTRRFGQDKTPVMHDYEPFHGPAGEPGSANYLFADLHVGDLK